ncbi:phosphoserine phosphatase SerB [Massilia sp. DWR3-1-1]|uniref:phosphoserine phosphatase SerB n=1 Tax=Massilia sp. DWR3-1-1 TaxID=2804559 RepID=UPI003CEE6E28
MTMKLILQGPGADMATLNRLAALAAPAGTRELSRHALRCDSVQADAATRQAVEAAALAARIDATFIASATTLADFGLLAMDMDSTLITIECIDEIADMQGLKPQVAAITEAAMRGEIGFADSLRRRVALLAGLSADALQRVYEERLQLSPGAETLLAAVKAANIQTLLVSGGFTFFTDHLRARLGLDYSNANTLEIVDGKLTGHVAGAIVDAEAKRDTVKLVCDELAIHPSQAIVMGDGANDLQMMSIAGLSVAFRAKPVVRQQADVALNFSGLDGLLHVLA